MSKTGQCGCALLSWKGGVHWGYLLFQHLDWNLNGLSLGFLVGEYSPFLIVRSGGSSLLHCFRTCSLVLLVLLCLVGLGRRLDSGPLPSWSLDIHLHVDAKRIERSSHKVPNPLQVFLSTSLRHASSSKSFLCCLSSRVSRCMGIGGRGLRLSMSLLVISCGTRCCSSRLARLLSHPALHHGLKGGASPGTCSSRPLPVPLASSPSHSPTSSSHSSHPHAPHSSHVTSSATPKHSAASPKEWRRGRWNPCSGGGASCLLLLLLLFLPAPAPLLGLLLHLVDPLEQSLGPDHLRAADPHHVVVRVLPGLLAGSAQVVVIADDTLVAETNDRGLVASIARDSMMGHICSNSRLLRLFHFLSGAHSCRELVHGAWQLGESQDELLVRVDGNRVAILIRPGNGEDLVRKDGEDGDQLLLDVDEASGHLLVHHKPPHFSFLPL